MYQQLRDQSGYWWQISDEVVQVQLATYISPKPLQLQVAF
jgi:hypothetical protein